MAIPASAYAGAMAAARKKDNLQPFATPKITPTAVTPGDPNVSKMMAATYAAVPQGVSAAQTKTPQPYAIPAYGSNIANFDPNNPDHIKLADAGQAYGTAKMKGDTAGMSAAAALGQSLRAQNGQDEVYDAKKGITTFQTPQPVAAAVNPAPVIPNAVTNVRSESELRQSSGDQNAIERAALLTAINERMASIRNNANYEKQLLQDERVLQDAEMDRNLNPFSGRTSYIKSNVMRGRAIDDAARSGEIGNKLNAVNEELYNFDKLAPERQRQIYNELLQLERQFGLNVGQLTGNYGNQRTLAGQQFDADQEQRAWENRFNYGQATGQFSNGKKTLDMQRFEEDKRRYGEEFAYRKVRDEIADVQDKKEFDEKVRQSGIDNAVQWYNANTSRTSSNNAASNAEHNRLMDIWKATGKAPAGISGVTPGTAWYEGAAKANEPVKLNDKDSTDNYNMILDDLESPGVTKAKARELLQANKDYLTDQDYARLNNWINDNL